MKNLTKQELINLATSQDIRFKKSWNKQQIQEAIESGIKNSDPLWIECSRSGLKFDAADSRMTVHPEISKWTTAKDLEIRYCAIEAIAEGKKRGFKTLVEFESLIQEYLNPQELKDDEVVESCHQITITDTGKAALRFRKAWIAKIVKLSAKYDFERVFLKEHSLEGRDRSFQIKEEGFYQCKSYSGKGNESISWWKLQDNKLSEISYDEIIEVFGNPEELKFQIQQEKEAKKALIEKSFVTNAAENTVTKINGEYWYVLESCEIHEDEDGITHDYYSHSYDGAIHISSRFVAGCRAATEDEIKAFNQEQAQKNSEENSKVTLIAEFNKLVSAIKSTQSISPESCPFPGGQKITLKKGYGRDKEFLVIDDDKIWNLLYNGADGDDWSYNNIPGGYIGCYFVKSDRVIKRLIEIAKLLNLAE